MKYNVNLASHPYEDVHRFYVKWVPLLVGLALITLALCGKAYLSYLEGRSIDNQISERRKQIDKLQTEQMAAQNTLNLPENSGTSHQAQFLNSLFARKAFSWTQVMADLEKIMPPQVQVVSIHPELDADGQLKFTLDVSTNHRESAIELVRRMETSPRFREAEIRSESYKPQASGTDSAEKKVKVEILALYAPDLSREIAESRMEK